MRPPPSGGGGGGGGGGAACEAETDAALCATAGRTCGASTLTDRCGQGRAVDCGACTAPMVCTTAGKCECRSPSDASLCATAGVTCGIQALTDACGRVRTVSCGTCSGFLSCGPTGRCECTAETNAEFCARAGRACGSASGLDNCGQARMVASCGTCNGSNACRAGVCSCAGETDAQFCARQGATCGTVTANDSCGQLRSTQCGACSAPQTCGGGGQPRACGCNPETDPVFCARLGRGCGPMTAPDNFGVTRTTSCGSCTGVDSCGGAGTPGVCGCTPESDAALCGRLGLSCGPVTTTDNCGATRTVQSCGGAHGCATEGATECVSGALRTCGTRTDGCRAWGATSPCPGGVCATASTCGSCSNVCTLGQTRCQGGSQQTCIADGTGCLVWGPPATCANGCRDALVCEPCAHECPAWGASCNGNVSQTCVLDGQGCRKRLDKACSFGCAAGQCTLCPGTFQPLLSQAQANQTAFFDELQVQGTAALATWRQRNGVYTEPDAGVTAFTVSGPAAVTRALGLASAPFDEPRGLTWVGNRAWFYNNNEGVRVLDTTNPLSPVPLATYPRPGAPNDYNRGLSVSGNRLCLATDTGIELIDWNGLSGTRVGTVPVAAGAVRCAGTWAAVLSNDKLQVWNLTNPAVPQIAAEHIGASSSAYHYSSLSFDGSILVTQQNGLEVWRFTPPSTLTLVGTNTMWSGGRFQLAGSTLGFAESVVLGTMDLSTLATPSLKKAFVFPPGATAAAVSGDRLYAVGDGLSVFDLSLVSDLTLLSAPSGSAPYRVIQAGGLAYSVRSGALKITDHRTPTAPVLMSSTSISGADDVMLAGSQALVAVAGPSNFNSTASLRSYDVRNPWAPVLSSTVSLSSEYGTLERLRLAGNRLFAVCDSSKLCVFDVSTPSAPTLLGRTTYVSTSDYELMGQFLVMAGTNAVRVLDASNFLALNEVGRVALTGGPPSNGYTFEVALSGTTAYVARGCPNGVGRTFDVCLDIVDLSNPSAPVLRSTTPFTHHMPSAGYATHQTQGDVIDLRVEGRWAFAAHRWGGVSVFDVSNPALPRQDTTLFTLWNPGLGFSTDRYVTTWVKSDPPVRQTDQVVELCR